MKSSTRYDGAVERNLSNAERRKATKYSNVGNKPYAGNGPVDYAGKRLDIAKSLLGIREDDNRFDERIEALTKKGG